MTDSSVCTVAGTVAHLERIALPPGAVITVRLIDLAQQDGPPTVLAATAVPVTHQVPVGFSLSVDAAMIGAYADLALSAYLRSAVGDWQSEAEPVALADGEAHVDLVVRRLPAPAPTETGA